ncbi:glutamate--cysteine ligase [Pseudarthrobacter sp. J1738]|uniref:glutamate--cysteine ligase n=1 Tax=Pseudarthrobacter sp. J1738 TaxID=3420446 RepID=UPI003D2A1580
MRTFGVEEELLIVDPVTGVPLAIADRLLAEDTAPEGEGLTAEFKLEQIETQTEPCSDYAELLRQIRASRAMADAAAHAHGARIAALATSPVATEPHTTPMQRTAEINRRFGLMAADQLTCGFHVHTSVESDEEGVAILDRMREWLPVLVALSANSPYWNGKESGYASYRSQAWNRWPMAGPTEVFGSLENYRSLVDRMVGTGVALDQGMIYFDARVSKDQPTVEVRVADICLRAEDAALLAVLVRALVETSARSAVAGNAPAGTPVVLLEMASWQASRAGIDGELLHPETFTPQPARAVVDSLLEHVREVLREQGEWDVAAAAVADIFARGNGARVQREAFETSGGFAGVVAKAVGVTHDGAGPLGESRSRENEPSPRLKRVLPGI